MPWKTTIDRARRDLRRGKAPSTAAGEFVREEMEHIRRGKHGARSPQQAIAIGLSKARRAGVPLRPPGKGRVQERTRRSATRAYAKGQQEHPGRSVGQPRKPARRRSRAVEGALKREPRSAASRSALSKQARQAWARRRRRGETTARPRARAASSRTRRTSKSARTRGRRSTGTGR